MKNKLKISTKYGGHIKKIEQIKSSLKNNPEGLSPKNISFYTKINTNTIKSILEKLEQKGIVKRNENIRGLYHLVEQTLHGGILDYNLQNINLTYESNKIEIKEEIIESNSVDNIIKFRFNIGKGTKKASMNISTDYSVNFSSLCIIGKLFQELVYKHCNIYPALEDITLATIEINKDDYSLRLDGLTCIRLNTLLAEFKIYQKENCVREEYKIKVPITFDTINKLLRNGLITTEIFCRLENQNKLITKLQNNFNELIKTYKKVLGKVLDKSKIKYE